MTRDHSAAIALGLGAGGAALLWVLFRARKDAGASAPAPTATTSTTATTSGASSAEATASSAPATTSTPVRTPGACQLRLDTSGLTADGKTLTVADAVDHCKPAGKADLVYAHDAPATTLTDVYRALTTAGVSVVVWAP